jgi:hypothetical protein
MNTGNIRCTPPVAAGSRLNEIVISTGRQEEPGDHPITLARLPHRIENAARVGRSLIQIPEGGGPRFSSIIRPLQIASGERIGALIRYAG